MKLEICNSMIDYVNEVEPRILAQDGEAAVMVLPQRTEVIYDSDEYCDVDYCKENNIVHCQMSNFPFVHCIVCVKGNVMLGIKRQPINYKVLSDIFVPAFVEFLKEKGLDVKTIDNDIMVSDYKVASGVEGSHNGYRYLGYQISLNQDIELIKKVCKKPMVKIPKGLSDFGVTTDEVIEFCNNFWEKY